MPERFDTMADRRRLYRPMNIFGVLEGLPRMFVSSQVALFAVLLVNPMDMRGDVVQFGSSLMVLVMRSGFVCVWHN